MIAQGHDYETILEHYTPGEINFFYRAALARRQTMLEESAVAARLANADEKGWKKFTKEIREANAKLMGTFETEHAAQIRKDSQAMSQFFGQISKARGQLQ